MFFELVRKNSKKNRKEYGLFFSSLIITIIAFYIILSLQNQDVVQFLKTMESDAVDKLFLLIPVMYGFSLFVLFFLVYFAGKYQLERRSHEFGMYLMLGMKRTRLLSMLLAEDISNSVYSLAAGIPAAIFLSEIISLLTAKVVGLGIIGHHFSFSGSAVIGTVIGYFGVRLSALAILSGKFAKKQIKELLAESQEEKHREPIKTMLSIHLFSGIILLGIAYVSAIKGNVWENSMAMGVTIAAGLAGTFLFFLGIGFLFQMLLRKIKNKNGLGIFTFRQLQESIFLKSSSIAISSLLTLMALCLFGYGIAVFANSNNSEIHVLDYTFRGDEVTVRKELERVGVLDEMKALFEIKAGIYSPDDETAFSAQPLIERVEEYEDVPDKDILLNHLGYFNDSYLISLSGYNQLLKLSGKQELKLKEHEVALYSSPGSAYGNTADILRDVLSQGAYLELAHEKYELAENLYQDNIVTDRSITISYGLIVSDEMYQRLVEEGKKGSYWNAVLKEEVVEEKGLLQTIAKVNTVLSTTELEYESYLQNMGRNLFYKVAASYTTIYLAVIFLIISNTVIGVQFLMQQQKTRKRYQTLILLGADYKGLCRAAGKQVHWYFLLPILVAVFSSIFGIRALFTGITASFIREQISSLMLLAAAAVLFLCIVEFCYMTAVKRISNQNIRRMMKIKREDD